MRSLLLLLCLIASACEAKSAPVGQLDVALTHVPADASCVRVSVGGARKEVRSFELGVAQKASFSIVDVPAGTVTVMVTTFSGPCRLVPPGAPPSSYGDTASALIRPEVTALAVLPMIHNGQATLGADRHP